DERFADNRISTFCHIVVGAHKSIDRNCTGGATRMPGGAVAISRGGELRAVFGAGWLPAFCAAEANRVRWSRMGRVEFRGTRSHAHGGGQGPSRSAAPADRGLRFAPMSVPGRRSQANGRADGLYRAENEDG